MVYDLYKISQGLDCNIIINSENTFRYISIDSRTITEVRQSLFVAIRGLNHNGHNFIEELYKSGVRNFVIDKKYKINSNLSQANYIIVENTLDALQQIAANKRKQFDIPVIGITGSNGKTIVKEWIWQLIGNSKVTVRSPRSYNSQVGVPLSVWQIDENTEIGIFEAGISKCNEMYKLAEIILPTIGVITNIGDAHSKNFNSLKEKLQEKLLLFNSCNTIIYNKDNKIIDEEISKNYKNKNLFTWGKDVSNNLVVVGVENTNVSTKISLISNNKKFDVVINMTGEIVVENALNAISTLLALGYNEEYISNAVSGLEPVAMRMELKEGVNNCVIINDTYNSDLNSLKIALDFLHQQSSNNDVNRTLILSDIYQSSIVDVELFEEINKLLINRKINKFIGVGLNLCKHSDLFTVNYSEFYKNTDSFINTISPTSFNNEIILVKGSREFNFEKITNLLEQQHHQTRLEINLNALNDNLNFYRNKLKPDTKLMAMVKAFGYGAGAKEISNILQHNKIDYLGAAFTDESVELRKAGIKIPIISLNPEENSFNTMLEYRIEPEIYNFRILELFSKAVEKQGLLLYPIHIKIDSGMNRQGFIYEDLPRLVEVLKTKKYLHVSSVFSHLAGADDDVFDDFTIQQINYFDKCTKLLEQELGYTTIKHILNSAGILRFSQYQYNMVRLGIGLYGFDSSKSKKLKNVIRFKSFISQIKTVKAGDTVGYSRKGKLNYDAKVATIQVGYADGLNRQLSNGKGFMMVNGEKAPILGNICMDMCMLDITGIDAKEGDDVEIFGDNISVNYLAEVLNTIPYEIFTGISRRVKRIYYYE